MLCLIDTAQGPDGPFAASISHCLISVVAAAGNMIANISLLHVKDNMHCNWATFVVVMYVVFAESAGQTCRYYTEVAVVLHWLLSFNINMSTLSRHLSLTASSGITCYGA